MTPSSYLPLARKYRPKTFTELCGQGPTATALANAISLGREPHAIIFSGVRGVGKTTSARLYAKALNCAQRVAAEPCNKCESCCAITIGNHEDVIEIDGASNTSVDDVRALRETISYVPRRSKFKVYIIDEVHMLSQSAFNALLKTLEEPPAHVVFVFATTELQKIPETILSRCQVFHLQKLSLQVIRKRLAEILESESISCEEKAIVAIAREGHGSMRDALTLLDHVIAVGGGTVSVAALETIISNVSSTKFLNLLEALITRNPAAVIECFDLFEEAGVPMKDVAEKTAGVARHAFIVRDVGIDSLDFKALGMDDEETRILRDIALRAGPTDLNRIFRTLTKACLDLDGSEIDRYILENYSLEWCLDPGIVLSPNNLSQQPVIQSTANSQSRAITEPSLAATPNPKISVASIRESLNSKAADTLRSDSSKVETEPAQAAEAQSADLIKSSPEPSNLSRALPNSWRECVDLWKKHNPLQAKKLEDVHPKTYSEQLIELIVPADSFLSATLLKPEEQKKLRDSFLELFGYKGPIVFKPKATPNGTEEGREGNLPENLTTIQQRETSAKREKATVDAKNNPITQDAIKLFNATIESVELSPKEKL